MRDESWSSDRLMERVRGLLSSRRPEEIEGPGVERRAAVATVLRAREREVEVLLIRRAERPNDPWSGQMAFPGGKHEPDDRTLLDTAVRETREELGVGLDAIAEPLGALDDIRATARGTVTGLVVRPYVWLLRETPVFVPNDEVAEVHWLAMTPAMTGLRDTTIDYRHGDLSLRLPAYRVSETPDARVVWGLTHRMLSRFFEELRAG